MPRLRNKVNRYVQDAKWEGAELNTDFFAWGMGELWPADVAFNGPLQLSPYPWSYVGPEDKVIVFCNMRSQKHQKMLDRITDYCMAIGADYYYCLVD